MAKRRSQSWMSSEIGGLPMWALIALAATMMLVGSWAALTSLTREAAPLSTRTPWTPTISDEIDFVDFPTRGDGSIGAVFLGDSLSYGLYASSEAAGFRPQVIDALSSVAPVSASRGGQTGNTVQTVGDSAEIPPDTGLVVLELGTNDVWKTPVSDFSRQYQALVAKVTDAAPDAVLVCLGVWANIDGSRNYNPSIQTPCEEAGGIYVPISPLFEKDGMRGPAGVTSFGGTSDDFHPNDDGYAAIAQMVNASLDLPR